MTETPKCPYCGAEMELKYVCGEYFCLCAVCEATSPIGTSKEAALSAAFHCAEPENRLLTLEEIIEKLEDKEWNVVWMECPIQRVTVPMCPQYRDGDTIICCAPLIQCKEKLSNYGKTWRCWPRKPTPEQMRAEKWEE